MFKKHYFASAIIKKNGKEVRTVTVTGCDWFWVSHKDMFKNIQDEIWAFCAEDMDEHEWNSIHVASFNRI